MSVLGSPPAPEADEIPESPHILIVRLSSMGDVLRFLPLAGALKRRCPGAHVTWIVGARCGDVVEMCRDVDEVLVVNADPVSPRRHWLAALLRFAPKLRRRRFDVAIDCHSTVLSAAIMAMSRAARRLGIDKPIAFNFRLFPYHAVDRRSATPIDYHLSVLRFFDVELDQLTPLAGRDPGSTGRRIARGLQGSVNPGGKPLIAIHHDTSLESKLWAAEKFGALANQLRCETDAVIVVIGEKASERFEAIQRICDPEIVFHHGLSIRELAAFLERCDLVIAHDSGPLHLAAALCRPRPVRSPPGSAGEAARV